MPHNPLLGTIRQIFDTFGTENLDEEPKDTVWFGGDHFVGCFVRRAGMAGTAGTGASIF